MVGQNTTLNQNRDKILVVKNIPLVVIGTIGLILAILAKFFQKFKNGI